MSDILKDLLSLSKKMEEQIELDKFDDEIPFGETDKDKSISEFRKNANSNFADLQLIIKSLTKSN
jgi:hypothetical protein